METLTQRCMNIIYVNTSVRFLTGVLPSLGTKMTKNHVVLGQVMTLRMFDLTKKIGKHVLKSRREGRMTNVLSIKINKITGVMKTSDAASQKLMKLRNKRSSIRWAECVSTQLIVESRRILVDING